MLIICVCSYLITFSYRLKYVTKTVILILYKVVLAVYLFCKFSFFVILKLISYIFCCLYFYYIVISIVFKFYIIAIAISLFYESSYMVILIACNISFFIFNLCSITFVVICPLDFISKWILFSYNIVILVISIFILYFIKFCFISN